MRVLEKIQQIIRSELKNRLHGNFHAFSSAIRIMEESGRWDKYGPELFDLKIGMIEIFVLVPL
ncbi:MAG: hypothetical protein Ct9H90mP18_10270 [Gammaproteobacteria bacterium]|nr:MAG: hypothetical protein Ct9H90mP18_10270 [Gammaproteobacteria bacterium]